LNPDTAQAGLAIGFDQPAVEFGTTSGSIGETPDPACSGDLCTLNDAGQGQEHRASHDVADALAKTQAGCHPALEIGLDLLRCRTRDLAHHHAMSSLHHAAEWRMKREIVKGRAIVHAIDSGRILLEGGLAAVEIGQ